MDILTAECPVIDLILAADCITSAGKGDDGLLGGVGCIEISVSGISTIPAEGADSHARNGDEPEASDKVLIVVNILDIDTLTIVNTDLVVKERVVVKLEEIALELETKVTAVGCMLFDTVIHAGEVACRLAVAVEALLDRVHRVLEGECSLELSELDIEGLVFLPLDISVYDTGTADAS